MIVFKGDSVKTKCGLTGEVTETWGIARRFVRLRLQGGKTIPLFERDIVEIIKRPKSPQGRR